jgi:2-aminoadipate transaminase
MTNYDRFLARAASVMQESGIRKMGSLMAQAPDVISFAPGYPAPETFPWDAVAEIAADLLRARDGRTLQYGPTRGYRRLLEALVEILASRHITARLEELIVTTGSQQALDLCARVLVDPGDVVLVELPAYTGAITAFRNVMNVMADIVGVRQQADGIDLDDLSAVLARERRRGRRIGFLYVVPNFQNPTGLLMSPAKRQALLEWAGREDLLIVEDDPYGDLYFEDSTAVGETRPMKADDRDGRVVYLSTFSKLLAPGFRVGWIAAPAPITAKFELAKQAEDLCTGGLDQRIVLELYRRGILAAQRPMLRAHYQQKRDVMTTALRQELAGLVQWPAPRGGFFLWATLPERLSADAMIARALKHRVIYVAGSAFFVDGSGPNTIRLSFSEPPPERIVEGVARLARTIREELADTGSPRPLDSIRTAS